MSLPTANLTAHWDAATAADLFKTFVSGGPHTGTPVDGDNIEVWDDSAVSNSILKQTGSSLKPTWVSPGPMAHPSVRFTGGRGLAQTNDSGTARAISNLITASDFTVIIAFRVNSSSHTPGQVYQEEAIFIDSGGFVGISVKPNGIGGYTLTGWNWVGGFAPIVVKTIALATDYVVTFRHTGGVIYMSLDGGTEVTASAGNTADITGNLYLGLGYSSGFPFDGWIGEAAFWNVALTGTDLSDANDFFTSKWLGAAPAATFSPFLTGF